MASALPWTNRKGGVSFPEYDAAQRRPLRARQHDGGPDGAVAAAAARGQGGYRVAAVGVPGHGDPGRVDQPGQGPVRPAPGGHQPADHEGHVRRLVRQVVLGGIGGPAVGEREVRCGDYVARAGPGAEEGPVAAGALQVARGEEHTGERPIGGLGGGCRPCAGYQMDVGRTHGIAWSRDRSVSRSESVAT